AYCGGPVCAKTLVCSKFEIYTSMRIRDDLKEGLSTFYAELMRIKQIIDASKEETNILFLIDEIFRGTNSIDRIEGAKSVLKSLNHKCAIGALTTHDLELCALAKEDRIKNYHFTECYEKNSIVFDYRLKQGPSTSTNAKYLMNMVGIEV
ncbi:MAG: MutS-related protein, partial [Cellulosilyticaceae bacterium]